jgi:myo-inositol-1(or 4)-monophosphatase
MSYLSPVLTLLVNAVKKATTSLDRDFSEIEKLQSSIRNYQTFVTKSYEKVAQVLRNELLRVKPNTPVIDNDIPIAQGPCFLVNPIDGFTNFIRGIPDFATTVAYCENGEVKASVIYNRASDELYFAEKGNGAYKEGFRSHERLRVSPVKEAEQALIAAQIGYNYDTPEYNESLLKVLKNSKNIRMTGAVSLNMAYVAAGKNDICLSLGNRFNSVAAGLLLVKEAGGYIYGLNNKKITPEKIDQVVAFNDIAAANNSIEALVEQITK